jgi:hypothetical protein
MGVLTYRLTRPLTFDEFRLAYLDLLELGQEYDLYGFRKAAVLAYIAEANNPQVTTIFKMRAAKKSHEISKKRSHKVMQSNHLWQLTTDGGARFLYFQDGPRTFIFVHASDKVKENKFNNEIGRAEQLRIEYLQLKEGKLK